METEKLEIELPKDLVTVMRDEALQDCRTLEQQIHYILKNRHKVLSCLSNIAIPANKQFEIETRPDWATGPVICSGL